MFRQLFNRLTTIKPNKIGGLTSLRFNSTEYQACHGLSIESKDQVLWIKLARPDKFNAITAEMYDKMTDTFIQVNEDQSIKAVVLTGTGDYYCSGNDLSNFLVARKDPGGPQAGMAKCKSILLRFVDSLINVNKLMIAGINGPALGIAVTTLPLFDYVIASDTATFQTPFTSLGQCPEACSSHTFPHILGNTRATEMLLLNMKWDAKKAQAYGLISDVVEKSKFEEHLQNLLYSKRGIVNTCYPESLMVARSLIRGGRSKDRLMEINRRECDAILKCWLGAESSDALEKFFKR